MDAERGEKTGQTDEFGISITKTKKKIPRNKRASSIAITDALYHILVPRWIRSDPSNHSAPSPLSKVLP